MSDNKVEGIMKLTMTNKEAAELLKDLVKNLHYVNGRGNGKSMTVLCYFKAFAKAIDLLEKTPD